MSIINPRRLDAIRPGLSERENHFVDELGRGGLSRRDFLRAASVAGMSLPLAGFIAAPALAAKKATSLKAGPKAGAKAAKRAPLLRVGVLAPQGAVDPVLANNQGSLLLLGQTGEYLAFSNNNLELEPRVALSWSPNADSTLWTFKLRKGIKFHNGKPLTADDVVASFDRIADATNKKSNALSVFKGVLQKGNIKKVDDYTVTFQLDTPTGGFPYLVSSDNYNAIILPRDYAGGWDTSFIGSGPWILEKYTADQSVSLKRNPTYWDAARQPRFDRLVLTLFPPESFSQAGLAQLQGGQLDALSFTSTANGTALKGDSNFVVQSSHTSGHLQLHMRSDQGPFADKRLRQAFALTLDRDAILKGVADGFGVLGNDSPMAPAYTTTDKSVAQRKKDLVKAKQLLTDAGKPDGFEVQLDSYHRADIDLLSQVAVAAGKEIGINIKLNLQDNYYDKAWLNSDMGITDYGHRGVPNVYLNAALKSDGVWNAAHYKSADFDAAAKAFISAPEAVAQKAASKKVQEILLEDSPMVIANFGDVLTIVRKNLTGLKTTGMGHVEATEAVLG